MKNRTPTTNVERESTDLDLIYKLGGDFSEGIEVAALCPMLAALSDLIQVSNKTIVGTEKEITVRIKPFEEGSLIINLALQAKDAFQSAMDFANQNDCSKLRTLLECIGLVAGGGAGLLKLIRFLKGKPKKVRKISPSQVEYTNDSDNKLVVNGNVHALFQNCTVLATLDKAVTQPLKLAKVTNLQTYLPNQESQTKVTLAKTDVPFLEAATSGVPESSGLDGKNINLQTVWVSPKTGNYEGEPTSWSFRKIGDKTAFRAKLKDESFLDDLKTGAVRLSCKDVLRVELQETQNVEEGKLTREITKVLEYKPAPVQNTFR
jgi:hypothetical protein